MEAGCKKKHWLEDEHGFKKEYKWIPSGILLAKGACINERYQKHLVPEPGKTKVSSRIQNEKVRHVDSRKQTVALDLVLTMRWWDPNINTQNLADNSTNTGLILSPGAVKEIWTPDLTIQDLTSFKIKEEWTSLITSKMLPTDNPDQANNPNETLANVQLTYEIKAEVYCVFDHSKYPMDIQNCNFALGSRSFGAIFVLDHEKRRSNDSQSYPASNFYVSSELFDSEIKDGSNTIGIKITMNHAITPFFVKYYLPCIAIVLVSMIGFAVPLNAIPGRVALLVTQFLTLTNLFIYEMVRTHF